MSNQPNKKDGSQHLDRFKSTENGTDDAGTCDTSVSMHAKRRHGSICCGLFDREVFLHRYTLLMIFLDCLGIIFFFVSYIMLIGELL